MKNIILNFNDPNSLNISFSGYKGANIAKLYQFGFNTPLGIIISSKAYQLFLEQAHWLEKDITKLNLKNENILSQQTHFIQEKLRQLPVPEIIIEEIKRSSIILSNKIAIRPSFILENIEQDNTHSLHKTYLNIKSNNISNYIKEIWVSLWDKDIILQRYKRGISLHKDSVAIIIQNMIQAEKSGILFTIDSTNGDFDSSIIESNYGINLKGNIINENFEFDTYLVDKNNHKIQNNIIRKKEKRIKSVIEGISLFENDNKEKLESTLSEKEIKKLLKVGSKIEKEYLLPVKIQWSYFAFDFYILDVTPITNIIPQWVRDTERFPNPVTPLYWEFIEKDLHESLNFSLELMGKPKFAGQWFKQFDSYIYSNQNAIKLYSHNDLLNVNNILDLKNKLPNLIDKSKWINELPAKWFANLDDYLMKIGEISNIDLSNKNIPQLWLHILEINAISSNYFLPNMAISTTQKFLYNTLIKVLSLLVPENKVYNIFNDLIGFTETKSSLINQKLYNIAIYMQKNKSFFDQFNNGKHFLSFNPVKEEEILIYSNFMQQFNNILIHHGHKKIDFDPYIPTWSESPDLVYDILKDMYNSSLSDPKLEMEHIRKKSAIALFKIQCAIPENYLYLFSELVRLTQLYTLLVDIENYETTRLTLPLRAALRSVGLQLVSYNIINEPMDIFFANKSELEDCIYNGNDEKWLTLKDNIISNKLLYLQSNK